MSLFDKIAAKVMPPETDEDRAEARAKAQALSQGEDWLALALGHHRQIEAAFARALDPGADAAGRRQAVKDLALVLTGHAQAEEIVLYPALTEAGDKSGAMMAYSEQAMTKVEMHLLEQLDPLSQEWREKLEHIQGAVQHHVYEEESDWFPAIAKELPADQRAILTQRFAEEFQRYAGRNRIEEPLSEQA